MNYFFQVTRIKQLTINLLGIPISVCLMGCVLLLTAALGNVLDGSIDNISVFFLMSFNLGLIKNICRTAQHYTNKVSCRLVFFKN